MLDNRATMDLNAALVFVRVAQAGSFTAASRILRMPISTVSMKVAQLETQLGTSLLQRTTRKLHLTEAGERFFQHAARAISELQEAEASTSMDRTEIQGTLRVTATIEMGTTVLPDLIAGFLRAHPLLNVELVLTDRFVDLVGEGIDLAIRFGELEDSSLISKKIGLTRFEVFASPAYLKRNGTPRKPQDLERHECLHFTMLDEPALWELRNSGKTARVLTRSRLQANNLSSLHRLALRGQGIALLPHFLCEPDVESGKLVPILSDWVAEPSPAHVVYPQQRFIPLRLRVFVDYLTEHLVDFF